MKKLLCATALAVCLAACSTKDYTCYVDPFIGTAYTGHTYPAATTPFGMVQVGPDTGNRGWQFCSGYHDSSRSIMGFSHTHLNGTGCPDMGDILLMPVVACNEWDAGSDDDTSTGYRSRFSTENEDAAPGYYKVLLDDYSVIAEMTASPRVGFHRYTFPESAESAVIIDLEHGMEDRLTESYIRVADTKTIVGKRRSSGFVKDHWYYFCARFSDPFVSFESPEGKEDSKIKLHFDTKEVQQLLVKVSLSTVSEEGAVMNMDSEVPGWDFEDVRKAAAKEWNRLLSRMEISDPDHDKMVAAYTSLYHALLMPNLITDVDGSYTGWDHQTHKSSDGEMYTNFSLWDTYRAEHSLLNLLYPEINARLVNSLIEKHKQDGLLVTNEYGICETWCMIGNHAVPVIVDACLKGLPVDPDAAYDAIRHTLTTSHNKSDWETWDKYGYYPYDIVLTESVSRSLEHCYDDWCAAKMALKLGKNDDYAYFLNRSFFYKNLFDKETNLMRPKDSLGTWSTPFDPFFVAHEAVNGGAYTEGNAWQYTWHVQHDPKGLIALFESPEAFVNQMDILFNSQEGLHNSNEIKDVTGLIGQYAHGNEPSHHVAYLYTLAGRPDKTAGIVRKVFDQFYMARRDGLCGNDDCGQMSSWYLFSGMGFYPVDPVCGEYVFGAPQFESVLLHLPNGKQFKVSADGISRDKLYVGGVFLNGNEIPYESISYDAIMNGGELRYQME